VLLVGINAKYIHSNLAIRYLSKVDTRCHFREYSIADREETIAADLYKSGCRIFMFSCYIWNITHVLRVCEILKKADSGLTLALGGPEVAFSAEACLCENQQVDFVLCGEGETSITAFVDALQSGDFESVPGLYYRKNGTVAQSGLPSAEADLEQLPFPYDDADMKNLQHRIVYFETSRGCPYRCAFCLSGGAGSLRFLPLHKVEQAIDFFARHKVPLVKLVDRTFNADPHRALAIIEMIKQKNSGTTYHFEIRAESMTQALIESLQTAPTGMFQLEIGVQSVNPATLEKVNRKPQHEKLEQVVHALSQNNNIHLHLDLIAGLPGESFEAFVHSFHVLMGMRPHQLQLGFLKRLKGSTLQAPGSRFADFPPYEVICSDAMSYSELLRLKAAEDVLEKYYNSGMFEKTVPYILETHYKNREFYFFDELASFLAMHRGTVGQKALYETLYAFFEAHFADETVAHHLIFDYALRHRDYLSFMQPVPHLKEWAFAFLKDESLVSTYFEKYVGEKPVILYKKLHFVPIGKRIFAFDYEGKACGVDVTEAFEAVRQHNL